MNIGKEQREERKPFQYAVYSRPQIAFSGQQFAILQDFLYTVQLRRMQKKKTSKYFFLLMTEGLLYYSSRWGVDWERKKNSPPLPKDCGEGCK